MKAELGGGSGPAGQLGTGAPSGAQTAGGEGAASQEQPAQ